MSHRTETPDLAITQLDSAGTRACCSASRLLTPILLLLTVGSLCIAAFFIGRQQAAEPVGQLSDVQNADVQTLIDQLPSIHASASAFSEKYSIATGAVSDESEGFFVLDHNSGLLQCNVIYPRRGQFLAQFSTNVAQTLGTGGKGGTYIMVTGGANFIRSSSNPAAPSVVYVLDTGSGNYACFGIPFNESLVARGAPQQGNLVLLARGTASAIIDRDQLR